MANSPQAQTGRRNLWLRLSFACLILGLHVPAHLAAAEPADWNRASQLEPMLGPSFIQIGSEEQLALHAGVEWRHPVPVNYVLRLRGTGLQSMEDEDTRQGTLGGRFGYRHSHDYSSWLELSLGLDAQQLAFSDEDHTAAQLALEARASVPIWFDFELELASSLGLPIPGSDGADALHLQGLGAVRRYRRPGHWQSWRLRWWDLPLAESDLQRVDFAWAFGWAW